MPEPPDFDQIARGIVDAVFVDVEGLDMFSTAPENWKEVATQNAAEQLLAIWNARGAADQSAIAERLSTLVGWVTSEPYVQHLREAIAALDRTS